MEVKKIKAIKDVEEEVFQFTAEEVVLIFTLFGLMYHRPLLDLLGETRYSAYRTLYYKVSEHFPVEAF